MPASRIRKAHSHFWWKFHEYGIWRLKGLLSSVGISVSCVWAARSKQGDCQGRGARFGSWHEGYTRDRALKSLPCVWRC